MGEIIPIPLGPQSDPAKEMAAGDCALVNCYVERSQSGKNDFAVYVDPGLTTFSTVGTTTNIRGLFALGNKLYVVADENLYSVDASGGETFLGIIFGTAPVIMERNRKLTPQIVIAADANVYILEGSTLTEMTDVHLPTGVHSVAFMDGFIIYGIRDGRFYLSSFDEAADVDAADFGTADGAPDQSVRVYVHGRELWIFGTETTEIWSNTGNLVFPFERLGGAFMTVGCASKYTPASFDNTMVWVTNKGIVVRAETYQGRRISNHAVERDIQRTLDANRAEEIGAFVYAEEGHEFYQVSGPDWTWTYDASTELWHPKNSYGMLRSRQHQYARCYNKHLVGDIADGVIYQVDSEAFDEAGEPLITEIRPTVMHSDAGRICWNALFLDMRMGTGDLGTGVLATDTLDPEYEPKVMLSWSDDGGQNYGSEVEGSLGQHGQYKRRIRFNRLGTSDVQGRTYKIKMSAGVKRVTMAAYADIDVLEP